MSEVQFYEAGDSRASHATIITALELTAYFGAVELMNKLPSILNTSLGAAELGHAIFSALCNEQGAALRLLIDMGADISVKRLFEDGLLSLAAFHGDLDATQLLLDLGADPNERDKWLEGPVEKAAGHGYTAVVRLLLERGGSFGNEDDGQLTVVDYAVETDNKTMIRDFFETTTDPKKEESLKALLLRAAVTYKHVEYIEMMLEMGPLPMLMGEFGSKLLYKAMTESELPKETIELLYEKGARPMEGSKEEILCKTKIDKEWLAEKIPSLFTE